ncbi:choline kinase family protein [Rubrobacter marinus]|uniref:choline kinase family protein n=1 Tax=Rubrobacter marinus TaxID=2653852 RepID=UPI001408C816|nr:choline kinase family protein [Rubrobacter marinus]
MLLGTALSVLSRASLPVGTGTGDVRVERLSGALTNASYKVITDGGVYVMRLSGTGTSGFVDRASEGHNARVAAGLGINAEVVYCDPRDGTMLTRFVEGRSMDEGGRLGRERGALVRATLALRKVHDGGRPFVSRFDAFSMMERYLVLLSGLGAPVPAVYQKLARGAGAVRRVLEESPVRLVPCHNDPWPGNLLDTGRRIYVIDWEYSGMNDPMWDLGALSVEAGLGPEQDRQMLLAYYGGAVSPMLRSRLLLYKAVGDLHWALWALVQHANRNAAEDFLAYALGRLKRCKARMESPDFVRHLDVVRAARGRSGRRNPVPPEVDATGSLAV